MYMYEHGQGVGKSYERAFEYYEQANKLYMCVVHYLGNASKHNTIWDVLYVVHVYANNRTKRGKKTAGQGDELAIAQLQRMKN